MTETEKVVWGQVFAAVYAAKLAKYTSEPRPADVSKIADHAVEILRCQSDIDRRRQLPEATAAWPDRSKLYCTMHLCAFADCFSEGRKMCDPK